MISNKIIIYDTLSFTTLLIAIIMNPFVKEQYFIDYRKYLLKFRVILENLYIKQITVLDFLDKGTISKRSILLINKANRIHKKNKSLSKFFINYFKNEKFYYQINQLLLISLRKQSILYLYTKLFVQDLNKSNVDNQYVYISTKSNIFFEDCIQNLKYIYLYACIAKLISIYKLLFNFIIFTIFPVIAIIYYLILRKISLNKEHIIYKKKDILYIHENKDLYVSSFTRDMYLFRRGIINIEDCYHGILKAHKLNNKKFQYINEHGGCVINFKLYKINLKYILHKIIYEYYKNSIDLIKLVNNDILSFKLTKSLLICLIQSWKYENILKYIDCKIIYFENDADDINRLVSIISNKYDINSVSMPHGIGVFMFPYYRRANLTYNYFFVSGTSYKRDFELQNPGIDKFIKIGLIEIDDTDITSNDYQLLKKMSSNYKNVIAVLASFYYPFMGKYHAWPLTNPIYYTDDLQNKLYYYWEEFFKWSAKQQSILFIFKGKPNTDQFEDIHLMNLINMIPSENIYIDNKLDLKSVIKISDISIISANSSTEYASLCLNTPSVALDIFYSEYSSRIYSNEYLVTSNPNTLVSNIEYVLENGLDKDVYDKVKLDHHIPNAATDYSFTAIKESINKMII